MFINIEVHYTFMEGIDPNYANKVSNTQKYVLPALTALILAGAGTYYYSSSNSVKQVQNNANPIQTAQVQTNTNPAQTVKSEAKGSSYLEEISKPISGFFGKYVLKETQDKINSGLDSRLSGLEKRMELAEKVTGKDVVSKHSIDYNLDGNLDLFELRDNNTAVVYLNDKEGKPYEMLPLSAIALANFVSRYKNESHTVPSKQTAKNLYQMGINAEIITCNNLNDFSNLIKLAEVDPKCEK